MVRGPRLGVPQNSPDQRVVVKLTGTPQGTDEKSRSGVSIRIRLLRRTLPREKFSESPGCRGTRGVTDYSV